MSKKIIMDKEENSNSFIDKKEELTENFLSGYQENESNVKYQNENFNLTELVEIVPQQLTFLQSNDRNEFISGCQSLINMSCFDTINEEILNHLIDIIFDFSNIEKSITTIHLLTSIFTQRPELKNQFICEKIGERRIGELIDDIIDDFDLTETITNDFVAFFEAFLDMLPEGIEILYHHAILNAIFTIFAMDLIDSPIEIYANFYSIARLSLYHLSDYRKHLNIYKLIMKSIFEHASYPPNSLITDFLEVILASTDVFPIETVVSLTSNQTLDIIIGAYDILPDEGKIAVAHVFSILGDYITLKDELDEDVSKSGYKPDKNERKNMTVMGFVKQYFILRNPADFITRCYPNSPPKAKMYFHNCVTKLTLSYEPLFYDFLQKGYFDTCIDSFDEFDFKTKLTILNGLVPMFKYIDDEAVINFIISHRIHHLLFTYLAETDNITHIVHIILHSLSQLEKSGNEHFIQYIKDCFDDEFYSKLDDIEDQEDFADETKQLISLLREYADRIHRLYE